MTVAELIAALVALNRPDARVAICVHEDGIGDDCLDLVDFTIASEPGFPIYLDCTSDRLVTGKSIEALMQQEGWTFAD